MIVRLNAEAVQQLETIMKRTRYTNHTHCLQIMISQVINKLKIADEKKVGNAAA